jgi:hypothetical protein
LEEFDAHCRKAFGVDDDSDDEILDELFGEGGKGDGGRNGGGDEDRVEGDMDQDGEGNDEEEDDENGGEGNKKVGARGGQEGEGDDEEDEDFDEDMITAGINKAFADHDFKIPKKSPVSFEQVREFVARKLPDELRQNGGDMDAAMTWVRRSNLAHLSID